MRNWIKCIIFECLREIVKHQPMIISNRPPEKDDLYEMGTIWKVEGETYIAKTALVSWVPLPKPPNKVDKTDNEI